MTFLFGFIIAMFITMVLIPPLVRSAEKWQFVDIPSDRKVHSSKIPRIGGIAMVVGAIVPIIMWLSLHKDIVAFLVGIAVLFFFGVWDDRKNIDYRWKFFGQILAVLTVILFGGVKIEFLPLFGFDPVPDYVAIPVTLFFLLGVTNAVNLSDGLDGLAGGTVLLSLAMIALLAYSADDLQVVFISLAVIGSILGFLRFNTHPARIFMGDSGSQFLGFSVGVLSILLTQTNDSAFSSALPLLLLGLPIFDTLMVMAQRISKGKSPFLADKNHIHHKILALGFDHYEAVFFIYIVQASLVTLAYFLRYEADELIISVYLGFCLLVTLGFYMAKARHWHMDENKKSMLSRIISRNLSRYRGAGARNLAEVIVFLVSVSVPLYLLVGSLLVSEVSEDISILATITLIVLLVNSIKNWTKPFGWMERGAIYIAATFIIYLINHSSGIIAQTQFLQNLVFVFLALAVVIGFRYSKDRTFKMTPLDFIVIFTAFVVPSISNALGDDLDLNDIIAKLIILFYSIELLLTNIKKRWDLFRVFIYLPLAVLGVRGLIQ